MTRATCVNPEDITLREISLTQTDSRRTLPLRGGTSSGQTRRDAKHKPGCRGGRSGEQEVAVSRHGFCPFWEWRGDGCTARGMCSVPKTVHFKMVKMINFVLCDFYLNFKKSELASVITLPFSLAQPPGQIWGRGPPEQVRARWVLEASPVRAAGCPLTFLPISCMWPPPGPG